MIRKYSLLCVVVLLSLLFASGAMAQITFKKLPSGDVSTISTLNQTGTAYASIPQVAEQLGFRWEWDFFSRQLTCRRNANSITFTQEITFYDCNGTTRQLKTAPIRFGGSLYLPVEDVIAAFNMVCGNGLKWSPSSHAVIFTTGPYTISSVTCEQKQNGTLVLITLADSVPFDYTFFYPNLTLNFLGGSVDTMGIRQSKRQGLVDSVFGVQFKGSAQLSLMLANEIEDPQIDYVEDTRTIMVSLRPKHGKKPIIAPAVAPREKNAPAISSEQAVKTIVIDPGHGGKDPGAIGITGVKEKDIVLAIALDLRDRLQKEPSLTVYMTREKDVFIPLQDRTKFANKKKADLFISIHANAVPGSIKRKEQTRGYKVYFLSAAKNEDDKLVAMRENAVIKLEDKPQNYSSLQNVLIDLAGNEYLRESQDICGIIDQTFDKKLTKKIDKLNLGVGQANFWVLNGAYMPSVLLETGFLSNPEEEKMLDKKEFQQDMASAMYDAIKRFKKKYETGL